MQSRFFAGDSDDSDDASSVPSELSAGAKAAAVTAGEKKARFAYESDDQSSSGGEGRVARSSKDRTLDGLLSIIKQISNALKIGNWVGLQDGASSSCGGGRAPVTPASPPPTSPPFPPPPLFRV